MAEPQIIKKPETEEDFKQYIIEKFAPTIGYTSQFEQFYTSNRDYLKNKLELSDFWKDILQELKELDVEYRQKHKGFDIIIDPANIKIKSKPTASVSSKAFRNSVLENEEKYESKEYFDSFVLPETIFEKLNDILRTEIVVKYLDGIDLVVQHITTIANKHGYKSIVEPKIKDVGYYAKHIYISYPAKISNVDSTPKNINHSFEIQIRTQLQYAIKSILHKYYESDRVDLSKEMLKDTWRWEFNKPRFIANYIGHVLHFFDGLIVKVKNEKEE